MSHNRGLIVLFLSVIALAACNNNTNTKVVIKDSTVVKDTLREETDSLVYEDCFENFFKGLQQFSDSAKVLLKLRDDKQISFKNFASKELSPKYSRYGLKSIDGDTIPELIIYNYTGGAHCCDEISVFEKDNNNYSFKARLYGGFACIDSATNVFTFSFTEILGYFFSCYACGFSDSTKGFSTIREIELHYDNGKFVVNPYNASIDKQLMRNLEILKEHGYEEINELMDSGWRKEFAMNFAVWHYYHGRNWNETKKLFDNYYNFKDAVKVWKEFYDILKSMEKENSL